MCRPASPCTSSMTNRSRRGPHSSTSRWQATTRCRNCARPSTSFAMTVPRLVHRRLLGRSRRLWSRGARERAGRAAASRGTAGCAAGRRRVGRISNRAGGAHQHHPSRPGMRRVTVHLTTAMVSTSRCSTTASVDPRTTSRANRATASSACANGPRRSADPIEAGPTPRSRLPGCGPSSGAATVISVVIADDQALVRGGFRALLDAQDDIAVVGEAADGEEAVRLALELRPTSC